MVQTARFLCMYICRTDHSTAYTSGLRASFFRNHLHTVSSSVHDSSWQENSRPFDGIRCTLWCLTEAVPLSNLSGSKIQVVNRLGWFVQIQSLCARSRSPKMPCILLLIYLPLHINTLNGGSQYLRKPLAYGGSAASPKLNSIPVYCCVITQAKSCRA